MFGWKIAAEAHDSVHLETEAPTDCLLEDPPPVAPTQAAEDPDGPFQRGFAAGKSVQVCGHAALLRALGMHLTAAAQGRSRPSKTLGEIAVLVEKEIGVSPYTLWPDKDVPDLSEGTRLLLNEMMGTLMLTKQGKIELNTGAQKAASKLEKALGLAEGAIWPEGFHAPNSPNENLLELVRKHEQLLAYLVVQLGQYAGRNVRQVLGYLVAKYKLMNFPESIETTTFRHLDTRDTFAKLETDTKS
jgi:hypothetical protein